MKRNMLICTIGFMLLFCICAQGGQVFVNLKTKNEDSVYSIKTSKAQEFTGLLASLEEPILAYFVDDYGNHRLIRRKESEEAFVADSENILRQIFNGSPKEADCGRLGHKLSSDSRESTLSGEGGKAVYRVLSVPFSAGLGEEVNPIVAKESLLPKECLELEGKAWYSIPNASWYQSWNKDIYYDRWETRRILQVENWHDDLNFYKVKENNLGYEKVRRLMRAKVDGALEPIEDGSLRKELEFHSKTTWFMLPRTNNQPNQTGCYSWLENLRGEFWVVGEKQNIKPIYESKMADNRFVCYGSLIGKERYFYVLGTDIVKEWLKKFRMDSELVECTKVAFIPLKKSSKSLIYCYSRPEDSLYRFTIDEEEAPFIGFPKKIKLDFKVIDMAMDQDGTLFLAHEVEELPAPKDFFDLKNCFLESFKITKDKEKPVFEGDRNEDLEAREKAYIEYQKSLKKLTCNADYEFVISRSYNQYFYELPFGDDKVYKLDYSIFLGKVFYGCKVSFKNLSMAKLEANLEVLIEEAKKNRNLVGPIEDKVPNYTNTFSKPEYLDLAICNREY